MIIPATKEPNMSMTKKELLQYIQEETVPIKKYKQVLARLEIKGNITEEKHKQDIDYTAKLQEKDKLINDMSIKHKQEIAILEEEVRKQIKAIQVQAFSGVEGLKVELETKENLLIDSYHVIQALKKNTLNSTNTIVEMTDAFCTSLFNVKNKEE